MPRDDDGQGKLPRASSAPTVPAGRARSRPGDAPGVPAADAPHDRFALGGELGRGGMGRVVAATDRVLGREVAIKQALLDDEIGLRRFAHEAKITARLEHASIVPVHDAGVDETGRPYYVMRRIAGDHLADLVARAPDARARLALVPNVLAAVNAAAYAHAHGVIHRDIKPWNIVVAEYGETMLIDWGLARELADADADADADSDGEARSTSGTPGYMAPEQARGERLDERADVYALGATLLHVLLGKPILPETETRWLERVAAGEPPPLGALDREVPLDLAAIVGKALATAPAERYRNAGEMAADLRAFLAGQMVAAHDYTLWQRLVRVVRRHRVAVAVTVAVALAAIAIGVFSITKIVAAQRLAEAQRARAIANQSNAEELLRFMLIDLRNKLVSAGRLDVLDDIARRAAAYFDDRGPAHSDGDQQLVALARQGIAEVLEKRGDTVGARAEYEKALQAVDDLARRHPDDPVYPTKAAKLRYALARLRASTGELAPALATAREALRTALAVYAKHPGVLELMLVVYDGHREVALMLHQQGDSDGALAEHRRALAVASASPHADPRVRRRVAMAHASIGRLLRLDKRDPAGALAAHRTALAIFEELAANQPDDPARRADVATSRTAIGLVLLEQGDHAAAEVELEAAAKLRAALVDHDPTNADWQDELAITYDALGQVRFARGDRGGALAHYRRSQALSRELAARDPGNLGRRRDLSTTTNNIGDVQLASGDAEGALASYRDASAVREELVAKDPRNATWRRDRFYSHTRVARALYTLGRKSEALATLRTAVALAKENAALHPTNDGFHDDLAGAHETLGAMLFMLDQRDAARVEYLAGKEIAGRFAASPDAAPIWSARITRIDGMLARLGP